MQPPGVDRLGRHLKRLREDRKLTLGGVEDLSAVFGDRINKTYLFRVERGTTVPTLLRLHILARIYRVRLTALVDILEQARLEQKRKTDFGIDLSKNTFEDIRTKGIEAEDRGDFARAIQLYEAAAARARLEPPSADRKLKIATARHDLSIALRCSGEWELAREVAEDTFEVPGLPDLLRDKMRLNLAIIYRRLGQPVLASEILLGLQDRKDRVSPEIQALVYQEMGSLLLKSRPKEAARHYRKALALQRKLKNDIEICRLLTNVGVAERRSGRLDPSWKALIAAGELAQSMQFHHARAEVAAAMGKNAFIGGDLERAKRLFRECSEIARSGDYYELLFVSHYYLRTVATSLADPSAARAHEASARFFSKRVQQSCEELEEFRKERH